MTAENLSQHATLRRVIEQREREQEELAGAHTPTELLTLICPICRSQFSPGEAFPDRRVCEGCAVQRVHQVRIEKHEGVLRPEPLVPRTFTPPPMPEDPFITAVPLKPKEDPMPLATARWTCPFDDCKRQLRSHNTKGICGPCQSRGRTKPEGAPIPAEASPYHVNVKRKPGVELAPAKVELREEDLADDEKLTPSPKPLRAVAKASAKKGQLVDVELVEETPAQVTLRKFRMLAEALGFDADAELADYAQRRIDAATKAVSPIHAAPVAKNEDAEDAA